MVVEVSFTMMQLSKEAIDAVNKARQHVDHIVKEHKGNVCY